MDAFIDFSGSVLLQDLPLVPYRKQGLRSYIVLRIELKENTLKLEHRIRGKIAGCNANLDFYISTLIFACYHLVYQWGNENGSLAK